MTTPNSTGDASATYAIELTPPGRAAVAVVLVDGPAALAAVQRSFYALSGRSLRDVPLNRIAVGRWGGQGGEELVVARRSELQIEVHCHGGAAAVRGVIDTLVADGCRELDWREWLKLNHGSATAVSSKCDSRRDSTARDAQIALAEARTFRTAAILLDQMNGAFTAATENAIQALNAYDWDRASETVNAIWQYRDLGLHLATPWRVVLAGPPNVGKSSLINALAGFERAIVSPIPGTTRDIVTLTTAIGGWPMELADTAGLRSTSDELETAGIELTETALATADLVLRVYDATQLKTPPINEPPTVEPVPAAKQGRVLQVLNKVDLLSDDAAKKIGGEDAEARTAVRTSAVTGEGIAELAAAIERSLVPAPPEPGAAVPFIQRHIEALGVARSAIERHHADPAREALHSLLAN